MLSGQLPEFPRGPGPTACLLWLREAVHAAFLKGLAEGSQTRPVLPTLPVGRQIKGPPALFTRVRVAVSKQNWRFSVSVAESHFQGSRHRPPARRSPWSREVSWTAGGSRTAQVEGAMRARGLRSWAGGVKVRTTTWTGGGPGASRLPSRTGLGGHAGGSETAEPGPQEPHLGLFFNNFIFFQSEFNFQLSHNSSMAETLTHSLPSRNCRVTEPWVASSWDSD